MPVATLATHPKTEGGGEGPVLLLRSPRASITRELLIFLIFIALTALMTWPWALHLRDAVADPGDPYMIAWSLWWDYHQTFTDPLRLFHANVFYPCQYTLAFSENDYGLALLFFPLFALGVKPLTVHSIATFLGFAFSGYGMFRLARTLTGSLVAAWTAGIVFAFVPFRFHLLSHLHYLFAGWIPLALEALVLYARARSWRRAAWLGAAFLMNALTCITWFIMVLVPLALTVAFYVARDRRLLRERAFWLRAGVSVGVASLLLLPFLLPYYWVSVMYGLRWQEWEFAFNSPSLMHWLAGERRNKLWGQIGAHISGGHKLFPGLLAPLLALAALRFGQKRRDESAARQSRGELWPGLALEALMLLAAFIAVLALGYGDLTVRPFGVQLLRTDIRTPAYALTCLVVLLFVRLGLGLARDARRGRAFGEPWRASLSRWRNGEAVGVGLIWLAWGFLSSLGANFVINRLLHDYVILFQSLRFPSRWAMICYVGLALLAGAGAQALARLASRGRREADAALVVALVIAGALLFELRAFPLDFERGAVEPDALALRLKETPMRGGLVELPSELGLERHRYMLRAADHGRPLVNATSSFISPQTVAINQATREGALKSSFLDLLEGIPASYLVIHNAAVPPEQVASYENFIARAVATNRLRFVNRFDGRDDLYAVVKTEPEARSEAPLPFNASIREWSAMVADDPLMLLGEYREWSETLYRVRLVATGEMPRYERFLEDATTVGRGVFVGLEEEPEQFRASLLKFTDALARSPEFTSEYDSLDDARYVERLVSNAGLSLGEAERAGLAGDLREGRETRAGLLLKLADDRRLVEKERNRALVLLHFFAYLRRDPDAPPDRSLNGFNYWLAEVEKPGGKDLASAFSDSIERKALKAPAH